MEETIECGDEGQFMNAECVRKESYNHGDG